MKPEPLKGKGLEQYRCDKCKKITNIDLMGGNKFCLCNPEDFKDNLPKEYLSGRFYSDKELKSTMEWLRKKGKCFDKISKEPLTWKVVEGRLKKGFKNTILFVVDYNDLNKAFEDVTKNNTKEK